MAAHSLSAVGEYLYYEPNIVRSWVDTELHRVFNELDRTFECESDLSHGADSSSHTRACLKPPPLYLSSRISAISWRAGPALQEPFNGLVQRCRGAGPAWNMNASA